MSGNQTGTNQYGYDHPDEVKRQRRRRERQAWKRRKAFRAMTPIVTPDGLERARWSIVRGCFRILPSKEVAA